MGRCGEEAATSNKVQQGAGAKGTRVGLLLQPASACNMFRSIIYPLLIPPNVQTLVIHAKGCFNIRYLCQARRGFSIQLVREQCLKGYRDRFPQDMLSDKAAIKVETPPEVFFMCNGFWLVESAPSWDSVLEHDPILHESIWDREIPLNSIPMYLNFDFVSTIFRLTVVRHGK